MAALRDGQPGSFCAGKEGSHGVLEGLATRPKSQGGWGAAGFSYTNPWSGTRLPAQDIASAARRRRARSSRNGENRHFGLRPFPPVPAPPPTPEAVGPQPHSALSAPRRPGPRRSGEQRLRSGGRGGRRLRARPGPSQRSQERPRGSGLPARWPQGGAWPSNSRTVGTTGDATRSRSPTRGGAPSRLRARRRAHAQSPRGPGVRTHSCARGTCTAPAPPRAAPASVQALWPARTLCPLFLDTGNKQFQQHVTMHPTSLPRAALSPWTPWAPAWLPPASPNHLPCSLCRACLHIRPLSQAWERPPLCLNHINKQRVKQNGKTEENLSSEGTRKLSRKKTKEP